MRTNKDERIRKVNDCEVPCPYCWTRFMVVVTPQKPGYRSREELRCPKCGKLLIDTMEFEFEVLGIFDEENERDK